MQPTVTWYAEEVGHVIELLSKTHSWWCQYILALLIHKLWSADSAGWTGHVLRDWRSTMHMIIWPTSSAWYATHVKGGGYRKLIKYASFCCAVYFSLLSIMNVLNLPQLLLSWYLCAVQIGQLQYSQQLHKKARYWGQIQVVCGSFLEFLWLFLTKNPATVSWYCCSWTYRAIFLYSLAKAAKRLNCPPTHPQKYFWKFFWAEIHKTALYDHREGVVVQSGAGGVPIRCSFFEKTATNYICVLFVPYFYGRIYKYYLTIK